MIDNIKTQLKDAMISKDRDRIISLRNFLAKLKAKEIEKRESLSKSESLKILQSISKQLKDSIIQYTDGGREDLANREKDELVILNEFLPEPLSKEEMNKIIDEVIRECGASSMKDVGQVIGKSISRTNGMGDGSIISQLVREKLS